VRTPIRNPPTWLVYTGLIAVQVFFGLNYLAVSVVVRDFPPAAWALVRVASGAALLLIAARLSGRALPTDRPTLWRLAVYSLFGVVINQYCFVQGMARTSPTHASIIMTTIPVTTMIFAVVLGRERTEALKLFAFLTALAGVVIIVSRADGPGSGATLVGDLLILVNASSYALFLVISKRLMGRVDPLGASALLLGFGALGMLVPGLRPLLALDLGTISTEVWLLGAYIVVFPTAAAYLLTYWALAHVDSSVVAFFIYLQPLIATGLSVALFDEPLTAPILAGAGLIFLAVYLALHRRRAAAA